MKKAPYAALIRTIVPALLLSSCCQPFSIPIPDETPQDEYLIDILPGVIDQPFELDLEKLGLIVEDIKDGKYNKIHSLIIIHFDSLVLEEYFRGWTRHMRHYLFSVTKSFSSTLMGIAIEQGYINGVDDKVLSFFTEYDDFANPDQRQESITLANTLTMTAGYIWDEWSVPYSDECGNPNLENDLVKLMQSDDWIKHVLDLPMVDDPGTKFVYNTGVSHLFSGMIKNKVGISAEEFAEKNLFNALGITNWEWKKDPNDLTNTGGSQGGLHIHPVNMSMLGYLFFKNGSMDGKQVVPEDWVRESTSAKIPIINADTGEVAVNYGYQWWVSLNGKTFYANGFGGQFIFVIPGLNMIVVMTAENFEDASSAADILDSIIACLTIKEDFTPIITKEEIRFTSELY